MTHISFFNVNANDRNPSTFSKRATEKSVDDKNVFSKKKLRKNEEKISTECIERKFIGRMCELRT